VKLRLPFPILYEDRDVIVAVKPAGMLTTHTRLKENGTLEEYLNDYVRKGQAKSRKRVYLVHRLDRETSGVMMVAKSEAVAEKFRADWNSLTEKTYIAKVEGKLEADEGFFESYLRDDPKTMKVSSVKDPRFGKLARTEWRRLAETRSATLVEVTLKSGRKNQIRVHFSEVGHPVVGDIKYGGRRSDRLYLHSCRLKFKHPFSGEWLEFSDEMPKGGKNMDWGALLRGRQSLPFEDGLS
jgi:tRNA pseudouridine32 synthase/23S rRNA pseudouridine746 synthase/23S rRNA pseudouridine1911/1915/1917 synthase